ncbi:MAG TPA: YggT family protein [Pyrinomonadaceae bacterium]|jgi:YggT family protein|nr:YggT family protein [Pyrinomonadaceae bacterium]
MLIIQRILWFVNSGIQIVIIAVIALMIIRLITDAMDLNPFAWTSRTVRRLSDGFVMPVRGGLRQVGVEPKFAPLVVILLVIVLGYFIGWLAGTIGETIVGVLDSIRRGAVITAVGYIIFGLLSIYLIFIFARVVFSWGQISYRNRVMRFLINTTEPLLGPLRRMLPPLGWIDISPIVATIIILFLRAAVAGTLLMGAG